MKGESEAQCRKRMHEMQKAKHVNKLVQIGEATSVPLAVMLGNMEFWTKQARRLQGDLEDIYESMDSMSEKQKVRAVGKVERFLKAMDNSQRCAVEAAPYVHPKLASVTFKPESDEDAEKQRKIIEMTLPKPLTSGEDRSYRDAPPEPKMKVVKSDAS